jgi:HK97 family phage major capsid protein
MWIKFAKDVKDHKSGEIVEMADAAAKTLIDNGIAEAAQAPAEVVEATTAVKGQLQEFVESAVKTAIGDAIKELTPATRKAPRIPAEANEIEVKSPTWRLPAEVKRYGSLRNIKGVSPDGRPADQRAYEFGMWMLGMNGSEKALEFCKAKGFGYVPDDGTRQKTSRENSNVSSGFLVPDQFENDLIDLREEYGIFRKYAKIVPMSSDTRSDPRRTGGLTTYFVGESTSPTSSDKTWDRVRLTAKKIGCLTKYTRELSEDAVINIGDDLAGEIAYAFSKTEDDCGFNGDGTSTYGGIRGWRSSLASVSSNIGVTVANTTGSWGAVVLSDFNKLVGTLPLYAYSGGSGVGWYCHQAFYGAVMNKLELAAGGNTATEIANGAPAYKFLGFPVRITQQMPSATASTGIPVLFGNLALGSRLGDRRTTSVRMSDVALNSFEQDEIAVVGFERFDIVVHDYGTTSVGGPVVGLALA